MDELTSRQRAVLRSLAQTLKAITQIGREGVSDSVAKTIAEALNNRELLKVRVLDTAPGDPADLGADLARRIDGAHVVQVIGRTIVLYRRHPTDPQVTLPRS